MIPTLRRKIRTIALVATVLVLAVVARPVIFLIRAALRDRPGTEKLPPGFVDDASRLDATHVAEIWDAPEEPAEAERQLAALLRRAKAAGRKVSIAGARHTMGGQTIAPEGIVINTLPMHRMWLDEATDVLHVQTGARWSEIIPYLNDRGRSVAVMQSNNSFSVGGSLGANCHGWQPNRPPIASTVRSFRLMKADGSIVACSRNENAELFSLVLGGYGLFGVVLDVELSVVKNDRYRLETTLVPPEKYIAAFEAQVNGSSDVGMVYGRLSVVPDAFLREASLNVFHRVPSEEGVVPPLAHPEMDKIRRTVFRASADSDYGKKLRWAAEKRLAEHPSGTPLYRNQIQNEGVEVFQDRSDATTDILVEYFVPPEKFDDFVARMRDIVPRHHADLLNVTIRNVLRDEDAFLRYADRDMFAFVMLFNEPRTADGDAATAALTRELIDAAVALGGRYYLPYRLAATPAELRAAYPRADEFFLKKRWYDPDELFQNRFYLAYGHE